ARGLWVNIADDPVTSDFFMPATLRRGDFTIAIGTGGGAPALAHEVRRRLGAQFDEAFGPWVALLAELRPLIQARIPDAGQRRALWRRLCAWEWLDRFRREDPAAVRAAMQAELQTLAEQAGPVI